MTRREHLLVILMEECAELAKEASKALRFGVGDYNPSDLPDEGVDNAERMAREFDDLTAVVGMLRDEGVLRHVDRSAVTAKVNKVALFFNYSAERGTLDEPAPEGGS